MRISPNQRGSSHIVIFLAIAVIAVIGVVGYRVMSSDDDSTTNKSTATVIKKTETPAKLETNADVKQATSDLDATNVDSDVNPDQLDSDINSIQ